MRRVRLAAAAAAIAALAACAGIVISAYGASPARRDDAATAAYLRARASFLRAAAANVVEHDARLQRLVGEVSVGCPSVVAASPLEPEIVERRQADGAHRIAAAPSNRELFVRQVSTAVEVALRRGRADAFARFAAAVNGVRWRNVAVARRTRGSVREEAKAQRRTIPELCSEMRLWVKSDYMRAPSGVRPGRATIVGIDINGPLPNPRALFWPGAPQAYALLGFLEPLLSARQKSQLTTIRRLQTKLIFDEMQAVKGPTSDILHALGFYSHGALFGKPEAGAPGPAGSPYELDVPPPAEVRRKGGRELEEFEAGRVAVARSGCEACHRIGEAGNPGPGPPLTHVGSKLTEAEIRHVLLHPKAPMPSFKNLPPAKLHDIVKFLSLLK